MKSMAEEKPDESKHMVGEAPEIAAGPGADARKIPDVRNVGASGPVSKDARRRRNRAQKVGVVSSDKMKNTVVVRVDRLVKHMKYRRYVRRTSTFMAHDESGSSIGDKVRIVETRPLSARKRWRVVEIIQKAAK
jgi:small subunit ribosomal protein S17